MIALCESTPTERAALLTYWLTNGREMTTAEAAESLQVSQRTAQRLFTAVSRAGVPVYRDDDGTYRLNIGGSVRISPY